MCIRDRYFVARQDETWSVWPYLRGVRWRRIVIGVAVVVAIVVARELWERRAGTKGYGFGWRELRHYYVSNLMLPRPPSATLDRASAASDVYKVQAGGRICAAC